MKVKPGKKPTKTELRNYRAMVEDSPVCMGAGGVETYVMHSDTIISRSRLLAIIDMALGKEGR